MAARRSARRAGLHPALVFLLGVILGAGAGTGYFLAQREHPVRPGASSGARRSAALPRHAPAQAHTPPARPASPSAAPPPARNPEFSRAPAVVLPPRSPSPFRPLAPHAHARVAIIFDDAGYGLKAAQEIETIGRPVTISILPHLPYSSIIAEEAPAHGVQVLLHLPMQPDNPAIPVGEGGITVSMTDEQIRRAVAGDLATVPQAVGANNHMGSLGTSDPRVMRAVAAEMKARGLFFVDSVTTPRSVAAQVAHHMGVPTASRAVFLDNEDNDAYVRGQLRTLLSIAQTRGQAVAIGHVGKVTARVLASMLPEFDEAGVQLVPVSDLVR
jgi:polysaccharide deacetylase 2 family uncharacterized protein YibQ